MFAAAAAQNEGYNGEYDKDLEADVITPPEVIAAELETENQ